MQVAITLRDQEPATSNYSRTSPKAPLDTSTWGLKHHRKNSPTIISICRVTYSLTPFERYYLRDHVRNIEIFTVSLLHISSLRSCKMCEMRSKQSGTLFSIFALCRVGELHRSPSDHSSRNTRETLCNVNQISTRLPVYEIYITSMIKPADYRWQRRISHFKCLGI